MGKPDKLKCPACNSEAVYRYGHIHSGKQRLRCMMCGRQFVLSSRTKVNNRPVCPVCGKRMYIYRHDEKVMRFRCSGYPSCKSYSVVPLNKEVRCNELVCS